MRFDIGIELVGIITRIEPQRSKDGDKMGTSVASHGLRIVKEVNSPRKNTKIAKKENRKGIDEIYGVARSGSVDSLCNSTHLYMNFLLCSMRSFAVNSPTVASEHLQTFALTGIQCFSVYGRAAAWEWMKS